MLAYYSFYYLTLLLEAIYTVSNYIEKLQYLFLKYFNTITMLQLKHGLTKNAHMG